MGVNDFTKTFSGAFKAVKALKDVVKEKVVAIDMHLFLHKSIAALGPSAMTDSAGVSTAGLNNLLNWVPKLRKAGARKIIAVFDNPNGGCSLKGDTCRARAAVRSASEVKGAEAEDAATKDKMEKRAFTLDAAILKDAEQLAILLGVDVHIAPLGFEAEHYAAALGILGLVDVVISDDSDTVMFGAPLTLMAHGSKDVPDSVKCKSMSIALADLLSVYGLTMTEFRRICVTLGTDFAPKTRGVGPGTALTRGKNFALTAEQMAAMEYIASLPGPGTVLSGDLNLEAAAAWLSTAKGFSYDRVAKILGLNVTTSSLVIMPTCA